MKQAIVILLNKNPKLERIRKKYNKDSHKYKPHITLVYTFEVGDQKKLYEHIKKSLRDSKQIKLKLRGLQRSKKDYYLYLLVEEGKNNIISIYRRLNTGLLKDFKNKNMPRYVPHLSLGVFKRKKDIENAISELSRLNLSFDYKIKSIQLLNLKKDGILDKITNFKLKL
tara:strand:- start:7118 stop:7624 length:507 start_codon:yes stop_codon:yes gene_type:complete